MTSATPRSRWRARSALAFGAPAAVGAVLSLLLRTEAQALLAPVFGPWAGALFGHSDCTMASAAPEWTLAVALSATIGLGAYLWARPRAGPMSALLPGAIASVLWSSMAVLSVVNTLS